MIRLAVLLAALLAGCAGTPQPGTTEAPALPARAELLEDFRVDGKFAYRDGDYRQSANLSWLQHGSAFRIFLSGPLGQGARIEGNAGRITLYRSGEPPLESSDPQRLLADELGWSLPLDAMRWWVRGLADPAAPASTERDAEGRLRMLNQHGWLIEYSAYRNAGPLALPARLRLTRPAGPRLLLVLRAWSPLPAQRFDK